MSETPVPESYWVVPGRFLAGSYPFTSLLEEVLHSTRLVAFLEAGFDTFFDLTREGEQPSYLSILDKEAARYNISIQYHRLPIQDRNLPSREQMLILLDAIDAALAEGHKVYLHCVGGIGRTGTAVGCWLVRHGLTGRQALARLDELYHTTVQSSFFPRSPETSAQVEFVLNWEEPAPLHLPPFSEKMGEPSPLPPLPMGEGLRGEGVNWHARFLQQASWTRDLRSYLLGRAGLEHAQRVLEVGCGTGAILTDLATDATIHGLDLDPARLAEARLHAPAASLTCGNALALPYPPGIFDITFCHFLLLWVGEPLQALLEMKRVTRRGGSVLALAEPDYLHRVDKPAALAALGRWQTESLRRQGADPGLGARLEELFRQAGIQPIETGSLHSEEEHPSSSKEQALEWTVLENDLAGFVPAEEIQKMKSADGQAWQRGERVLYVPTYFAWGRVE